MIVDADEHWYHHCRTSDHANGSVRLWGSGIGASREHGLGSCSIQPRSPHPMSGAPATRRSEPVGAWGPAQSYRDLRYWHPSAAKHEFFICLGADELIDCTSYDFDTLAAGQFQLRRFRGS